MIRDIPGMATPSLSDATDTMPRLIGLIDMAIERLSEPTTDLVRPDVDVDASAD